MPVSNRLPTSPTRRTPPPRGGPRSAHLGAALEAPPVGYPPSEVHMKRFQAMQPRVTTSGASAVAAADSPIVGGARKWAMIGWATKRERWYRGVARAVTMLSLSPFLSVMSPRSLAADAGPPCDPSRPAIVYRPGVAPQFGRGRTTLVPCPTTRASRLVNRALDSVAADASFMRHGISKHHPTRAEWSA